MKAIRSFEHFPPEKSCVVCGTNEDAESVLLGIDGTADGNIEEAEPVHLACAIGLRIRKTNDGYIIYRIVHS